MCTCVCVCVTVYITIPNVHGQAERMPAFSRLRMRKIFPEILEIMLFWYSSVYGIHITVLFIILPCNGHLQ